MPKYAADRYKNSKKESNSPNNQSQVANDIDTVRKENSDLNKSESNNKIES